MGGVLYGNYGYPSSRVEPPSEFALSGWMLAVLIVICLIVLPFGFAARAITWLFGDR